MPKEAQTTNTQSSARAAAHNRPAPTRTMAGAETLVQRAMADPAALSAQDVIKLQRQFGNSATVGLLSRGSTPSIQRSPLGLPSSAPIAAGAWSKSYRVGPSLTKGSASAIQRAPSQFVTATPTTRDRSSSAPVLGSNRSPSVTPTQEDVPSPQNVQQSPPGPSSQQDVAPEGSVVEDENVTDVTAPTTEGDQSSESGSEVTEPTTRPRSNAVTTRPTTGPGSEDQAPTTRSRSDAVTTRPTSGPGSLPGNAPVVPIYPTILTEADWKRQRGLFASFGKDDISKQLGIVSALHRGVVWNRFDVDRLPPGRTVPALKSIDTASEATTAVEAAKTALATVKTTTDPTAKTAAAKVAAKAVSKAKELISTAHAAAKTSVTEAEGLLESAHNEYDRSVQTLVGRLVMLYDLLAAKEAKSPSAHLSAMADASDDYMGQLQALQGIRAAFDAAIDAAKDRETAMVNALAELETAEEEETQALSEVTPDDVDLETDGASGPKPVKNFIGAKVFSDLGKVKFPDNRDVRAWLSAQDVNISAKDETPNQPDLVRLHRESTEAATAYLDASHELRGLENTVLPRPEALDKVNEAWGEAKKAFGDENNGGMVGLHRDWNRKQSALAGSTGKFNTWKQKYARIMVLYTKTATVLKADETLIKGVDSQITQATH